MDQSVDGAVPKGLIVSAQRALRIMEVVAESGDGITAKAIARRADLRLSTAYQLINTLVHDGYLVRLANAHGFGLGYKLFELQCHAGAELYALPSISNVLRDLHPAASAPLYFTVFRDAEIVIADLADSDRYPRAKEVNVGFHEAPHATAYGKLMLASMGPEQRGEYLTSAGMSRVTKRTLTRRADLEEELLQIGDAGVAFESEEFQPGLTCLAVPVTDNDGNVRGAVATSSSTAHFLPRRDEIENVVRIAAARVTRIIAVTDGAALS
jgi:DNA-binding IclR family transcriptional regulator